MDALLGLFFIIYRTRSDHITTVICWMHPKSVLSFCTDLHHAKSLKWLQLEQSSSAHIVLLCLTEFLFGYLEKEAKGAPFCFSSFHCLCNIFNSLFPCCCVKGHWLMEVVSVETLKICDNLLYKGSLHRYSGQKALYGSAARFIQPDSPPH